MLAVISISINSAAGKNTRETAFFSPPTLVSLSNRGTSVTIAPFVVFSYINMLVFIRTKLASEASTSSKGAKTVERLLLLFTRTFHSKILRLVAYYEALIVIPAVIISALRGQSSPIVAFIYIKLFTFRYACSIYLRMAYNDIGKVLSFIFDNPYSPKIVSNIYRKSVDLLISACGTGLSRTRTSCS